MRVVYYTFISLKLYKKKIIKIFTNQIKTKDLI